MEFIRFGRGDSFDQQHFLHAVDFLELHFDDLVVGGLHRAADESRFDGQFAMAAVDQHQQLHARRAAVIEQRVERGADGAAGVQHVVHQDDVLALHGKRNFGGADHRLDADGGEVVAIEIDVENADRNGAVFERLDLGGQALRQRNAAAADADEGQLVEVFGLFQDFVRQPDQRAVDLGGAHELGFFAGQGHRPPISQRNMSAPVISWPASLSAASAAGRLWCLTRT